MASQGDTASNQTNWFYDVFLSFRGDTRDSFTDHLYQALLRRGLSVFRDDEGLEDGNPIKRSLVNAIQQSRASIVVLSENYASSTWCLDELVEILECKRLKKQLVWPIFYKVEASDVRHQRNSYAEAMAEHEKRFGEGSDRVQKWKSALFEVANLKGRPYKSGYESKLIEKIVKKATAKLQREQLDVGEYIVGHQSRVEELKSLLDIESNQTVCMLGIHGIGGMGKTTLAKALYNSINHQFEYAIFLENVREKWNSFMGLVCLQKEILSKFEGKNVMLSSASKGVTRLKDNFRCQRVLLVLDDVDNEDQLEKLARKCDWFGLGSRIIITTRDKHVLDLYDVEKRFEMKGLNDDEALQLFCWKAFKKSKPRMNYKEVSNRVVQYASGLPLALKVIGSHLAKKSVKACEDALNQYEKIPNKEILEILKISYDCLEDPAKDIFLDIACFFKGKSWGYVKPVWEKCDFFPSYNVEILVDKSLVTIQGDRLWMHDLIQDMGKKIVRSEDLKIPGKRSRLCCHQDVLKVLRDNSGSDQIEGIILDPPEEKEVNWNNNVFKKMTNLRILIIRRIRFTQGLDYLPNSLKVLDWAGYPSSKSIPSSFDPSDIVVLSLPYSHLTLEKSKPFQMVHLTYFDFSKCQYLTQFPDVSGVPNLSELYLYGCGNLTAIHHSVGFLQNLKRLDASGCKKLQDFPRRMSLPSLQALDLSFTSIEFFPCIKKRMCEPLTINLSSSPIKKLPDSISKLKGLKLLFIQSESVVVGGLPSELFMLPNMFSMHLDNCGVAVGESLRTLQSSHAMATTGPSTSEKPRYSPLTSLHCSNCGLTDEDLHIILCCFPNLEVLSVPGNEFVSLPAHIKESYKLETLDVSGCLKLEEIPELPKSITHVNAERCPRLSPSEVFKKLWSQASKEVYGLEFVWPRLTEIPDWFDRHDEGGMVSFWARRKFPVLALAFFLEEYARIKIMHLRINGDLYGCTGDDLLRSYPYGQASVHPHPSKHVAIVHLRHLFSNLERSTPVFQGHKWNHVEIEIECQGEHYYDTRCNVSSWGAYVYKQATNMEDIRFTCPSSLKRTLSIVDDDDSPKRKRVRKLKANNKGKDNSYRQEIN